MGPGFITCSDTPTAQAVIPTVAPALVPAIQLAAPQAVPSGRASRSSRRASCWLDYGTMELLWPTMVSRSR